MILIGEAPMLWQKQLNLSKFDAILDIVSMLFF